jgi:hypothetical protein
LKSISCTWIHYSYIIGTTIAQGNCKIGQHWSTWRRLFVCIGFFISKIVTYFRNLKLWLKRHPFPIPKIGKARMICSTEGFTFAPVLSLNMGQYHNKQDSDAQTLFTIVFLRGKYKYKRLHIVIKNSWILMIPKTSYLNFSISKFVQDMKYVDTAIISWQFINSNK